MNRDKYVSALKRELAGRCAREGGESADAVLRELARNGEGVEKRAPKAAAKKKPAAKVADEAAGEE